MAPHAEPTTSATTAHDKHQALIDGGYFDRLEAATVEVAQTYRPPAEHAHLDEEEDGRVVALVDECGMVCAHGPSIGAAVETALRWYLEATLGNRTARDLESCFGDNVPPATVEHFRGWVDGLRPIVLLGQVDATGLRGLPLGTRL